MIEMSASENGFSELTAGELKKFLENVPEHAVIDIRINSEETFDKFSWMISAKWTPQEKPSSNFLSHRPTNARKIVSEGQTGFFG